MRKTTEKAKSEFDSDLYRTSEEVGGNQLAPASDLYPRAAEQPSFGERKEWLLPEEVVHGEGQPSFGDLKE